MDWKRPGHELGKNKRRTKRYARLQVCARNMLRVAACAGTKEVVEPCLSSTH